MNQAKRMYIVTIALCESGSTAVLTVSIIFNVSQPLFPIQCRYYKNSCSRFILKGQTDYTCSKNLLFIYDHLFSSKQTSNFHITYTEKISNIELHYLAI